MRRNNIFRARKISAALKKAHEDKNADEKTRIIDALADIRHLCDLRGIQFSYVHTVAIMHYRAETNGIDDPNFLGRRS